MGLIRSAEKSAAMCVLSSGPLCCSITKDPDEILTSPSVSRRFGTTLRVGISHSQYGKCGIIQGDEERENNGDLGAAADARAREV
jgi:hypothetical protein